MNRRLFIGLAAFLTSMSQLIIPQEKISTKIITLCWFLNWAGLIFICEYITFKLNHQSLLRIVHFSPANMHRFIVAAVGGGIIIEGVGQWLGKLWFYPYFTSWQYLMICIPGFYLYMLTIAEGYLAMKAIADRLINWHSSNNRPKRTRLTNSMIRNVGIIMIVVGLLAIGVDYVSQGGYIFNIFSPSAFKVNFWMIVFLFVGIFLICESVEFKHREVSFITDIYRHYWNPIIAIFLSTFLIGLSMELLNIKLGFWVYVNWPLQNIHLLGLPIIMIAVAWPAQFVMFLSLFRAVTAKDSKDVWSSPKYSRLKSM